MSPRWPRARSCGSADDHRGGGAHPPPPWCSAPVDGERRESHATDRTVVERGPVAVVDHDHLAAAPVDHEPAAAAVLALEDQPGRTGGAPKAMAIRHTSARYAGRPLVTRNAAADGTAGAAARTRRRSRRTAAPGTP